jgi:hypothetical protein
MAQIPFSDHRNAAIYRSREMAPLQFACPDALRVIVRTTLDLVRWSP